MQFILSFRAPAQRFAVQHRRKGIGAVYVLVNSEAPSEILGHYTLSAAEVDVAQLSSTDQKKLPAYPVPCIRMGRLACRSEQRGHGLGKILMGCAIDRCLKVRSQLGAYALIVDAKDELPLLLPGLSFRRCCSRSPSLKLVDLFQKPCANNLNIYRCADYGIHGRVAGGEFADCDSFFNKLGVRA